MYLIPTIFHTLSALGDMSECSEKMPALTELTASSWTTNRYGHKKCWVVGIVGVESKSKEYRAWPKNCFPLHGQGSSKEMMLKLRLNNGTKSAWKRSGELIFRGK